MFWTQRSLTETTLNQRQEITWIVRIKIMAIMMILKYTLMSCAKLDLWTEFTSLDKRSNFSSPSASKISYAAPASVLKSEVKGTDEMRSMNSAPLM